MNWTQLLKDAGIPDSPGRAEVVREMKQDLAKRFYARQEELAAQEEALRQRLAAQGDTRKAIRSKVRVG